MSDLEVPSGPTVRISRTCTSKTEGTFWPKKGIYPDIGKFVISTHDFTLNRPACLLSLPVTVRTPHSHLCCPLTPHRPAAPPGPAWGGHVTHPGCLFPSLFGRAFKEAFVFTSLHENWNAKYQVNILTRWLHWQMTT